MFIFYLTACLAISTVLSQNAALYPNIQSSEGQIMNPDQIYFADGQRPQIADLPLNSKEAKKTHNMKQVDSYLQEYLNRNMPVPTQQRLNLNSDINRGRPSINLEPPTYDQTNYYTQNRYSEEGIKQDGVEIKQIPPALRIGPLSRSVTDFGLNLVKNIQQPGRNLVVSPFSVSTLLALLQQGAKGMTQQQITIALQMSPDVTAVTYKNLTENMRKRTSQNILNVATNIYVADAFQISPQFKSTAINNFNSEVTPTKFGVPEKAVQAINNWVASKTNNKITKLVSSESVGENTQLVLVNAVYFKGLWDLKFNPDNTRTGPFHLSNGSTQMASYMRMTRFFRTGVDRSNFAQIIVLPFEREQYSLMIILPSEITNIAQVLPTLTHEKLLEYHHLPLKETALELPKFTVRSDTDLNGALRKLGILNIFGAESELSGLGTYKSFSPQVSSALHTAMLSIDEQGGTAAAATAFSVVALSYDEPGEIFKANRPFIAVLWDSSSGVPLFISTIENPSV